MSKLQTQAYLDNIFVETIKEIISGKLVTLVKNTNH